MVLAEIQDHAVEPRARSICGSRLICLQRMSKGKPRIAPYRQARSVLKDLDRPVVIHITAVDIPFLWNIDYIFGALDVPLLPLLRDLHLISARTHCDKLIERLIVRGRNKADIEMDVGRYNLMEDIIELSESLRDISIYFLQLLFAVEEHGADVLGFFFLLKLIE